MKDKLKISNRDINLLLVLLIFGIGFGWFYFLYQPKTKFFSELSDRDAQLQNQVIQIKQKLKKEPVLDTEITDVKDKITEYSGRYYTIINQEDEIKNINKLTENTDIVFSSMSFSKSENNLSSLASESLSLLNYETVESVNADEAIENRKKLKKIPSVEQQALNYLESLDIIPTINVKSIISTATDAEKVDQLSTNIAYSGTYEGLEQLMYNIYANSKFMIIDNIGIITDSEGNLSGSLQVSMNGLPAIQDILPNPDSNYFLAKSSREANKDVYVPYEGFIKDTIKEPEIVEQEIQSLGNYQEIFSFNDPKKYFFVASGDDVNGNVKSSRIAKSGASAYMNYRFESRSNEGEANLVFSSSNPIIIDGENGVIDDIAIAINTSILNQNSFHIVLIDKFSQKYDINLHLTREDYLLDDRDYNRNYTGWFEAMAAVPKDIAYPFRIQRIYVKPVDEDAQLTGKAYFDSMRTLIRY